MIVVIDTEEVPPRGSVQTVIRCTVMDRADVAKAALKLNMKPGVFMRTVAVQAARKVLSERGQ